MSVKVTKRELAVQFVDMLERHPLKNLAPALIEAAFEAGYNRRDIPSLVRAVEHELNVRHQVVEVNLTTAHELPQAEITAIAEQVAAAAGATEFNVVHITDPALLGGYEATADGTTIRDSIRFNLTNSGVLHA